MTSLDPVIRLVGRPVLLLSYFLFTREIRRAPMPRDEPSGTVDDPAGVGTDPENLVFVGDVLTGGYGVVTHDISTHAQTARLVSAQRERSVTWVARVEPTRLARRLATSDVLEVGRADVALVALGVTDVLFMTRPTEWAQNLEAIAERLRDESGGACEIVFVAIPPLADFWRIASPARQLIRHQTRLLNAATRRLVARTPGTRYSPFPDLEGPAQAPGAVSWRRLHDEWARGLAPAVVAALESREEREGAARPTR